MGKRECPRPTRDEEVRTKPRDLTEEEARALVTKIKYSLLGLKIPPSDETPEEKKARIEREIEQLEQKRRKANFDTWSFGFGACANSPRANARRVRAERGVERTNQFYDKIIAELKASIEDIGN